MFNRFHDSAPTSNGMYTPVEKNNSISAFCPHYMWSPPVRNALHPTKRPFWFCFFSCFCSPIFFSRSIASTSKCDHHNVYRRQGINDVLQYVIIFSCNKQSRKVCFTSVLTRGLPGNAGTLRQGTRWTSFCRKRPIRRGLSLTSQLLDSTG